MAEIVKVVVATQSTVHGGSVRVESRSEQHGGSVLTVYGPAVEVLIAGRWLHAESFEADMGLDEGILLTLRDPRWVDLPLLEEDGTRREASRPDFSQHLRF